jgi:recombination protein RecR
MQLSSKVLENAVMQFSKLPGIGKRTALRLVLHLIDEPQEKVNLLAESIKTLKTDVKICTKCFNIADAALCNVCLNSSRKHEIICVVETIRDVIAIESTQQYNGSYHVLGGVISPLDGIGPNDIKINELIERIKAEPIEELIFALNPNIQSDTTSFYIQKNLPVLPKKITTIARGIAFGGELEYADEMTLGKSIMHRVAVTNL